MKPTPEPADGLVGVSPTEVLVRALGLVDIPLVDVRAKALDERQQLQILLEVVGQDDEHTSRQVVQRVCDERPGVMATVSWLGKRIFAWRQGLVVLRREDLVRRVVRLVDPDALACLHPDRHVPARERFDWGVVPVQHTGRLDSLLHEGTIDTHIHLGGALPPLFYWLVLMGCELPIHALTGVPAGRRGHAELESWQDAVATAAWRRLALAAAVEEERARQGLPPAFPHLAWAQLSRFRPAEPAGHGTHTEELQLPVSILGRRDAVLALSHSWRRQRRDGDPPFSDPLRGPELAGQHYACGERRLLVSLRQVLDDLPASAGDRRSRLERQLLAYLRCRNAFHLLLCYQSGSHGLMRFAEAFSRRSFVFSKRSQGRRQRREQRQARRLERWRIEVALNSQLDKAFDGAGNTGEKLPVRGIEMRVSFPGGNQTRRTFRAWLEGIQDHQRALQVPSRVALVVHLLKGSRPQPEARAEQTIRQLHAVLQDFPGLQQVIVGIDAAGDERSQPPRVFVPAFRQLRENQEKLRPFDGQDPVSLGYTFHVGEDMTDLLTGLRHIDEVASLILPPEEGGRLGHALALGEDPKRFYARRRGGSDPQLGCHLLDLVWAHGRLVEAGRAAAYQWLERRIIDLLDGSAPRLSRVHICFQAMGLDAPQARFFSELELLRKLGLRDAETRALRSERVTADARWLEMVAEVQGLLRKRLALRRICIEANPTSNLMIGDYGAYAQLPYPPILEAELPMSINTDDPGLFMTSLPGEFAALYSALEGQWTHRKILVWLRRRLFDAQQSTFLGPGLDLRKKSLRKRRRLLDKLLRYHPR